jgi:hypothetical protein
MESLTVYREWVNSYSQLTILKDCKGAVKKIITSSLQQPKKGLKQYVINGTVYLLNWDNITTRYQH